MKRKVLFSFLAGLAFVVHANNASANSEGGALTLPGTSPDRIMVVIHGTAARTLYESMTKTEHQSREDVEIAIGKQMMCGKEPTQYVCVVEVDAAGVVSAPQIQSQR